MTNLQRIGRPSEGNHLVKKGIRRALTVNRSLPDAELDAFVDALGTRIATFDKQAIAETKHLIDLNSLPPDAEIAPEWDAFLASVGRPAAQARIQKLFERGFHKPGDVESRLGYHVGRLGFPEE